MERRCARGALAFVLAGVAVFYAANLDRFGFWGDEVQTVRSITRDVPGMVRHRLENGHMPLFFGVEWLWARAAGFGEPALRLPAAVASAASGALVYALAARVARPAAGLVAAVLFFALPAQTSIALQARPNTFAQALLLLSTWLLVTARARPLERTRRRYGAVTALSLWTHYAAFPVAGSQLLLLSGTPRPLRRLARAAVLAFVSVSPLVVAFFAVARYDRRLRWTWDLPDRGPLAFFASPFVVSGPEAPLVLLLVGALALALAGAGARRLGTRSLPLLAVWLGPPALAGLATLTGAFDVTRVYRFFAATWAAQACLAGVAVTTGRRGARVLAALAAAALLALSLHQHADLLRRGEHAPWRQVVRALGRAGPDEVFAISLEPIRGLSVLFHYRGGAVYDLQRPHPTPYTRETLTSVLGSAQVTRTAELRTARQLERAPRPPKAWLPAGTRGIWIYLANPDSLEDPMARVAWEQLIEDFPRSEEIPVRRGRLVHRWRDAGDPDPR